MLPTFQDQPASSSPAPWSPRVLVVDDDPDMRCMVVDFLLDNGLRATGIVDRQEVERQLARDDLAMILLDLRLGARSGLDLLRGIRARSDLPVIIITGERRDEVDHVIGLELGADDYVTKPFSPRELLARIRAVLRRQAVNPGPRREAIRHRFEGWILDRRTRRLTAPDDAEVRLIKGEFALLCAFLDAPGRPLSREHLLQAARIHEDVFDRSIDVQVLRLRRKLDAGRTTGMIRTERGIGSVMGSDIRSIVRGTVPLAIFRQEGYAVTRGRLALPSLLATAAAPLLGSRLLDTMGASTMLAILAAAAVVNAALVLPLMPMALRR